MRDAHAMADMRMTILFSFGAIVVPVGRIFFTMELFPIHGIDWPWSDQPRLQSSLKDYSSVYRLPHTDIGMPLELRYCSLTACHLIWDIIMMFRPGLIGHSFNVFPADALQHLKIERTLS